MRKYGIVNYLSQHYFLDLNFTLIKQCNFTASGKYEILLSILVVGSSPYDQIHPLPQNHSIGWIMSYKELKHKLLNHETWFRESFVLYGNKGTDGCLTRWSNPIKVLRIYFLWNLFLRVKIYAAQRGSCILLTYQEEKKKRKRSCLLYFLFLVVLYGDQYLCFVYPGAPSTLHSFI